MRNLWWAKWHFGVLRYFPLGIPTVMFHTHSCINHWRYRTLATDIFTLKMEPKYHTETSVTNYPLKLGNSLGYQKPQNTFPPKFIFITNLIFSISTGTLALPVKPQIKCEFHPAAKLLFSTIQNEFGTKVSHLLQSCLQHASPGLHVTWFSCVLKL